eukprot:gene15646-14187_t
MAIKCTGRTFTIPLSRWLVGSRPKLWVGAGTTKVEPDFKKVKYNRRPAPPALARHRRDHFPPLGVPTPRPARRALLHATARFGYTRGPAARVDTPASRPLGSDRRDGRGTVRRPTDPLCFPWPRLGEWWGPPTGPGVWSLVRSLRELELSFLDGVTACARK